MANYRVRMNWFGWDPDGEISYFLTKWDTLGWMQGGEHRQRVPRVGVG